MSAEHGIIRRERHFHSRAMIEYHLTHAVLTAINCARTSGWSKRKLAQEMGLDESPPTVSRPCIRPQTDTCRTLQRHRSHCENRARVTLAGATFTPTHRNRYCLEDHYCCFGLGSPRVSLWILMRVERRISFRAAVPHLAGSTVSPSKDAPSPGFQQQQARARSGHLEVLVGAEAHIPPGRISQPWPGHDDDSHNPIPG